MYDDKCTLYFTRAPSEKAMDTNFDSIAQQAQNLLPRIEAPLQQFKDDVKQCEQWLEGSEPVIEQLLLHRKDPESERAKKHMKDPESERAKKHMKDPESESAKKHMKDPESERAKKRMKDPENEKAKKHLMILSSALGRWSLVQQLVKSGADPNSAHESSQLTPLHLAALGGHVSTTQALLTIPSIEVNAVDARGNTPLMCAAQSGFHAVVVSLLNHSANVKAMNKDGFTAFDFALAYGKTTVLKQLVEKWNPLTVDRLQEKHVFYKTCCFEACKNSWIDILSLLKENGFSLSIQLESGSDLVLTSCAYMQEDVLNYLIQCEIPLDEPEHEGTRPLFHACYNGSISMVELLCEKGADINALDKQGRSPAFMAAAGGHFDIIKFLENKKCNLQVVTKSGDSLLDAAIDSGNYDLFMYLWSRIKRPNETQCSLAHRAAAKLRKDILSEILTHHRNLIEEEDQKGNTPLLLACKRGSNLVLQLLKTLGADFSHANQKGNTPALYLSSLGSVELLCIVHEAGGKLEKPNWKGNTPILIACRKNHLPVVRYLCSHGCKLNSANYLGQTPAYFSAGHASSELLQFLLEQGAPLDEEANNRMTPLLVAAKKDRLEAVKLLLESKCRVNQVNTKGQNLVSFCAINGNVEMLKLAIEYEADLHVREKSGNIALITACENGRLEVLKILTSKGSPLDAKNYKNESGLHMAAKSGFVEVAKFLLENDVNPNSRDNDGNTPLMLAAKAGHDEIVQLLNQPKCDVHLHNKNGRNALHFASMQQNIRSIQQLLLMGTSAMQTDKAGKTPLMLASRVGNPEDSDSIEPFERLLSSKDGRKSLKFYDQKMRTCVHYAAEVGQHKILKRLHELGLHMDEPNVCGETPLIIAAKGKFSKSVEFLIKECQASVLATDHSGQSPVHKAASKGHLPVVKMLQSTGAEIDAQDRNGMTPLQLAAKMGFDSVVKFLQGKNCQDTSECGRQKANILHLAAKKGHVTIIERLKNRIDLVKAFTTEGENCLTLLTKSRDCPEIVSTLLVTLDVNNRNADGQTVLHIAARFGREASLQIILKESNCEKDCVDNEKNTALTP